MGPPQSHSRVASSRVLAEKRKVRFLAVDKAAIHVRYTWVWASTQFSLRPPEAEPSLTPSPTVLAKDCGWSKVLWPDAVPGANHSYKLWTLSSPKKFL